jgi:uncharacterized membrane protein YfcA
MILPIYCLPVAGLLIGILISLIGGGGGIFYIAILTGLFSIPMNQAVSVSLATIIPTTFAASISHFKAGNVNINVGLVLSAGGIIGVIAGSFLLGLLSLNVLKIVFGLFMLFMAGQMIFKTYRSKKSSNKGQKILEKEYITVNIVKKKKIFTFKNFKGLSFGFFGGIMSGLLGVSGTPPILAGLYNMKLSSVQVVGTSVMVLFFIALSGVITHTAFGHLDWYLVALLAVGTITGAILGPILGKKIDEKKLEKFYTPFFIVFIFLMGISMFF